MEKKKGRGSFKVLMMMDDVTFSGPFGQLLVCHGKLPSACLTTSSHLLG